MKFETKEYGYTNLHPTMYLLIQDGRIIGANQDDYLHPTMYLLIRITATYIVMNVIIYIPLCIY